MAKSRRNDNTTFNSEFEQPCAGAGGEGEAAEKGRQISHCFQGFIYIKCLMFNFLELLMPYISGEPQAVWQELHLGVPGGRLHPALQHPRHRHVPGQSVPGLRQECHDPWEISARFDLPQIIKM